MADEVSGSIFKIFTQAQWDEFQLSGEFIGSPADLRDGFIHMSLSEQVPGTLQKHFQNQQNLVIAECSVSSLGPKLIFEKSRGGALFPHLYRELLLAEIKSFRLHLSSES